MVDIESTEYCLYCNCKVIEIISFISKLCSTANRTQKAEENDTPHLQGRKLSLVFLLDGTLLKIDKTPTFIRVNFFAMENLHGVIVNKRFHGNLKLSAGHDACLYSRFFLKIVLSFSEIYKNIVTCLQNVQSKIFNPCRNWNWKHNDTKRN